MWGGVARDNGVDPECIIQQQEGMKRFYLNQRIYLNPPRFWEEQLLSDIFSIEFLELPVHQFADMLLQSVPYLHNY